MELTYEQELIEHILGYVYSGPSVLKTDGYKFAMAQAGFPMREETFYMSFRRKGMYYVPFDVETVIRGLLPTGQPRQHEASFLDSMGYSLTPGMVESIEMLKDKDSVTINAAPKGSWVREKEPFFALTCPSFPVSVMEPLALMLHFPIQVATEVLLNDKKEFRCTCEDEANIVHATLKAIGKDDSTRIITVEQERYEQDVSDRAQSLIDALDDKDPSRLFEVGMRACSCMEMHEIALQVLKDLGINSTSNVYLAEKLGMKAVGTTGHEHILRWGDDLTACRAMRDMRSGKPSCLPDTFSPIELGLPAAFKVMRETPNRDFFIRFDSGDQDVQLAMCVGQADLDNGDYIFEDSINDKKVLHFEALCNKFGIIKERRLYGAGGFFVKPEFTDLTRDRVSAVYKLSMTSNVPVMKTCDSAPAKASLPGVPVIFRQNTSGFTEFTEITGIIGQAGEEPPIGFSLLEAGMDRPSLDKDVAFSPTTRAYQALCVMRINEMSEKLA